jgi:hypothetical protein
MEVSKRKRKSWREKVKQRERKKIERVLEKRMTCSEGNSSYK